VGLTLGGTCLAAAGRHLGWPIWELTVLAPSLVWRGQVWRLVTWTFLGFSLAPLGLLFACACLYSFGSTLCYPVGWRRFLATYFAFAILTGVGTCLVGLLWAPVETMPYFTSWAIVGAIIVAWGISNPTGQMIFNFFLPATGQQVVYLTLIMIILNAF